MTYQSKRALRAKLSDAQNTIVSLRENNDGLWDALQKRSNTMRVLYPELAGVVGTFEWDALHERAEAIRRARQAEEDRKVLKEWEEAEGRQDVEARLGETVELP